MSSFAIVFRLKSGKILAVPESGSSVAPRTFPDRETAELFAREYPVFADIGVKYRIVELPLAFTLAEHVLR